MQIYRVTSVTVYSIPLIFIKSWLVIAMGQTRSSGWTNPRLVQGKDEDGLAVFSFEADKPTGPVLDVLAPIVVSTILRPDPGTRGVKVNSETNSSVRLGDIARALEDGGEETDFIPFDPADEAEFDPESIEAFNTSLQARIAARADRATHCDERQLLKIPTRVEFKTSGFKLYRRTRYNVTSLEFCYPTDLGQEAEEAIKRCLPVAIAAGVAAFPAGPGSAVAAFLAALKGCVGAELAGKVSVRIRNKEEIGPWHRV